MKKSTTPLSTITKKKGPIHSHPSKGSILHSLQSTVYICLHSNKTTEFESLLVVEEQKRTLFFVIVRYQVQDWSRLVEKIPFWGNGKIGNLRCAYDVAMEQEAQVRFRERIVHRSVWSTIKERLSPFKAARSRVLYEVRHSKKGPFHIWKTKAFRLRKGVAFFSPKLPTNFIWFCGCPPCFLLLLPALGLQNCQCGRRVRPSAEKPRGQL